MDLSAVIVVEIVYAVASLVLISAGLAVVFGMMKVINLAHGEFMMLGGYATITAVKLGINVFVAMLLVAPAIVGLIGLVVERLVIRRLYGRLVDTMLATWGLSLFFIGAVTMIFGNTTTGISTPIPGFTLGNYQVNGYNFFIILVAAVLLAGLAREPGLAGFPQTAKPLPEFVPPQVRDPSREFRSGELKGDPALLNVWASWCPPCLAELPLLISVTDEVRIYGINYKDKRTDEVKWLDRNGNAFIKSGHDPQGKVARKYGVYGVPETFVIDRDGRIVHRHTGPISVREWAHTFRPLIQRFNSVPD